MWALGTYWAISLRVLKNPAMIRSRIANKAPMELPTATATGNPSALVAAEFMIVTERSVPSGRPLASSAELILAVSRLVVTSDAADWLAVATAAETCMDSAAKRRDDIVSTLRMTTY